MASLDETRLVEDLNYILSTASQVWENLRNKRLFITGGTGFFGCWFLESFLWANSHLNLNAHAVVLTRNIKNFEKKCPHLAYSHSLSLHEGDVRTFIFPKGEFQYVIHAATDASVELNHKNPVLMWDTVVEGTRRVLDFCNACAANDLLFLSSGAVYGGQSGDIDAISEVCHPLVYSQERLSAYAAAKFSAEMMCNIYAHQYNIRIKIARCFAFVGPYLPIDVHFAIGNFIQHGLRGEPITVLGDGTAYRSYLYAADLMIWLWTILFQGQSLRPYNVGSDEVYSIAEISKLVAGCFDPSYPVHILGKSNPGIKPERYIPDINRTKNELKLHPKIGLVEAIERTIRWHRNS